MSQITQSECSKVISAKLKTRDFKILRYQQIEFDEIVGYLGDHCTLEITILRDNHEETYSFFMKSAPRVPSQRTFFEEIDGFSKEKNFFTKFHPMLKRHNIDIIDDVIPECYLVFDETFILDDLKRKGYVTLPSRSPLAIDCIKAALASLAKLHASGLILEETKSCRLTDEFSLKESFYSGQGSAEQALQSAKGGMRAFCDWAKTDEALKTRIVSGIEEKKTFAVPSSRFRNTICHADPWTKNFLFKFEDGKAINCVTVDWQTYRYGPPAQDVLAFIYLVADGDVRKTHFDELLAFYYGELSKAMGKFGFGDVVTREEFFQSCQYFKQFALTQSLTHFQVVLLSDEDGKELFGNPEKAKSVIFGDDRYEFVQKILAKDPVFRKRVCSSVEELIKLHEEKCN
ncbi:uncharacterized protein LOC103312981 [Tribolium castaneum]|uniref:CHK kinase-like domain-containing protein n=1 Tax=Tribolium castaneum TaxID=7070 RepID=D6WK26_TRICA|nr:PREDICTED: uncharacterized protein LOC103312981 [Tribolium castaneum]EFA03626.1 hypothetical protein TcasGA2_TC013719 [Tribolium castaneum]|eukprot:XP_008193197.1 PREDICTED: uncharacterized protein LOC103312981 [Tribolium castaneum]